ncbi:uncharacterized protein LOC144922049 [Branchiostoma floridae x Branchiostoma belcheri]
MTQQKPTPEEMSGCRSIRTLRTGPPAGRLVSLSLVLISVLCLVVITAGQEHISMIPHCPLFSNRAPRKQHMLSKCKRYREEACCFQEEIDRFFPSVPNPRGASKNCREHMTSLKCYICSPKQFLFYRNERVTVCEEFCNKWYDACFNASIEGERIGEWYSNGKQFCEGRKFSVMSAKAMEYDFQCYSYNYDDEQGNSSAQLFIEWELAVSNLLCVLAATLVWTPG